MSYRTPVLIVLVSIAGVLAITGWAAAQDCNGNSSPDDGEIERGESQDCNWNGVPDECDVRDPARDCDSNGVPDDCQPDCDLDGVADACEIAAGASDCNGDDIPDECDLTPSFRLDWPPGLVATGRDLTTLAAADFDGDGNLDLAVGAKSHIIWLRWSHNK